MRRNRGGVAAVGNAVGCAVGTGLVAGVAGTAAITLAQRIEMKLTGRSPSSTPAHAGATVLGVEPTSRSRAERFGTMVHWFYGTVWGVPRGLIHLTGVGGVWASMIHFLGIWGTGMIMLPALKASSPAWRWGAKTLAIDGLLHVVYATAAGWLSDAICTSHRRKTR